MKTVVDQLRGLFNSRSWGTGPFPRAFSGTALVIVIVLSLALSGCASKIVGSWAKRSSGSVEPPTSAPKIISGQKAYVYGYQHDVEIWKETGLFSSVEATSSLTPPLRGVLIVRQCTFRDINDWYDNIFGGTIFLVTLGILPKLTWYEESCSLKFYQNGTKIADTYLEIHEKEIFGWVTPFYDSNVWWQEESRMCANKLLRAIK